MALSDYTDRELVHGMFHQWREWGIAHRAVEDELVGRGYRTRVNHLAGDRSSHVSEENLLGQIILRERGESRRAELVEKLTAESEARVRSWTPEEIATLLSVQ